MTVCRLLSPLALLSALVLTTMAEAQAPPRQYTVITGTGETLYRMAVPPPLDGGGAAPSLAVLHSVMAQDLQLIGLFRILNPRGFLANLQREGVGIDPAVWQNVDAQGVIKMRATMVGGDLSVEFFLYEVARGKGPVLQKTYRGPPKEARYLAHQFGDDVVRYFTGERGVFMTKIAFVAASRGQKNSQIFVIDFDGHAPRRVSLTGRQNILPAWTRDGKLSWTSLLWANPDLYLGSLTGERPKRISHRPGLNTGAAWSPDGSKVAVTLSMDGNPEIYILSREGRIIRRLTTHPGIDASPTWSPDGSQIAFVSERAGSPQIYVISAEGGPARRLTFRGRYNQEPSWCPKQETPLIAFTGRDERGAFDVFTVHAETGEIKRLTQGQGNNTSPSWAPNGRLLVVSSSRGGLWLMTPEGYNQQQIYRGDAETPAWSWW